MDIDLTTTLCNCPDYQNEIRIEAFLCVYAYFHGIALPQIPWKFCPYCGRKFRHLAQSYGASRQVEWDVDVTPVDARQVDAV